jgi:hypothetical protein
MLLERAWCIASAAAFVYSAIMALADWPRAKNVRIPAVRATQDERNDIPRAQYSALTDSDASQALICAIREAGMTENTDSDAIRYIQELHAQGLSIVRDYARCPFVPPAGVS